MGVRHDPMSLKQGDGESAAQTEDLRGDTEFGRRFGDDSISLCE